MAVKIRLTRLGDKGNPFYRVVAADSRSPHGGKFLEVVGTYNPLVDPAEVKVNKDLAQSWLNKGATPTPTAKKVLEMAGILEATKYTPSENRVKKNQKAKTTKEENK
ncbi:MAG: 30S ribosomal protein S16 [Clostridia bacterium]|nr:30S ribosomal protein S16 [Clostridia bacterium]